LKVQVSHLSCTLGRRVGLEGDEDIDVATIDDVEVNLTLRDKVDWQNRWNERTTRRENSSGSERLINDFLVNVALRPRNSKKGGNDEKQTSPPRTEAQKIYSVAGISGCVIRCHFSDPFARDHANCSNHNLQNQSCVQHTSTEHMTGKRVMCTGILGNWWNTIDIEKRGFQWINRAISRKKKQ